MGKKIFDMDQKDVSGTSSFAHTGGIFNDALIMNASILKPIFDALIMNASILKPIFDGIEFQEDMKAEEGGAIIMEEDEDGVFRPKYPKKGEFIFRREEP